MKEVVKGIEAADEKRKNSLIKILPHSWRSRENLIEFSNEVFTRTFANVPAEEVKLSLDDAERQKNERKGGRISVWQKKGVYQYKADALRADLAKRVKKMFEGANPRLGRYGDLAVLLRNNVSTNQSLTVFCIGDFTLHGTLCEDCHLSNQ